MDLIHAKHPDLEVSVGDAPGIDKMVKDWCDARAVPCKVYIARWVEHGRAAGPKRNQEMVGDGAYQGGVVFPGGRGTADCMARMRRAGIPVWTSGGTHEMVAFRAKQGGAGTD